MKLWFHQFMLLSPPLGTSFQALTQYHRHLAVVLGSNLDSRMFWRTTTGLYRHEVLTVLHLGNGMPLALQQFQNLPCQLHSRQG